VSARAHQLAAHVRALGDHDLNDLLVELPPGRFAALVEVALARPVHPAGLVFRFEPIPAADPPGWTVVACGPRRELGTVTREQAPSPTRKRPPVIWRAFTCYGEPVTDGTGWAWPRRADAAAALAWATPASGARALVLAAYARALGDDDLGDLLVELPVDRFDALLGVAFPDPTEAGAAA
jgi:DNA-directed RNA polymerase subunit K/omega